MISTSSINEIAIHERSDVTLIPLALEHAPNMYRWMCRAEISDNLGLRTQPTFEKTVAWIKNSQQDPLTQPFAVLVDEQHVGNVVLDRIDHYISSTRLSVYIGETQNSRRGVGRTAMYLRCVRRSRTWGYIRFG